MRFMLVLALLCALGIGARATGIDVPANYRNTFPPYACDRNATRSPFSLSGYTTSTLANGDSRVCFTVAPLDRCDRASQCCTKADFNKLELDSRTQCAMSIGKVYLTVAGGREVEVKKAFYPYGSKGKAVWKITDLGLNRKNAAGAKICLTLKKGKPCSTISTLCNPGGGQCKYATVESGTCKCCPVGMLGGTPPPPNNPSPSPPPPPPPPPPPGGVDLMPPPSPPGSPSTTTNFPFCQCNRRFGLLPYAIDNARPTVTTKPKSGNKVYCYTLKAQACGRAKCKPNAPFYKIEFLIPNKCRGSVAAASIGGENLPWIWAPKTFRLKPSSVIPHSSIVASSKKVCIELKAGSSCPDLNEFCAGGAGQCTVALFQSRETSPDAPCPAQVLPTA